MEDTRKKIQNLLKSKEIMMEIYKKYPNVSDSELLELLIAQEKIEDIKNKRPLLKEVLIGYWEKYHINPIRILNYIQKKTDEDILIDFEKNKYISGKNQTKNRTKNIFNSEVGDSFKTGIPRDDMGGSFTSTPNDFNL